MSAGRAMWLSCVAVASACAAPGAPPPAEPQGTPYREYLADGRTPTGRPPGTTEGEAMRVHLIDVGQGTAALIELPCGAVLVDTGGEQNAEFDGLAALVAYLDGFFIRRRDLMRRLDLLVVSHPHLDHTRGVETVLSRYEVGNVVDNGDVREEPGGVEQIAMHAVVEKKRIGHLDVAAADVGPAGLTSPVIDPVTSCEGSAVDPEIRILWGGPLGREEVGHDPNDDSVVVRIDFGEASVLLAGDLEKLGIARLLKRFAARPEMLDADVFVVPHHGSKHSTAAALDRAVSPEVALISSGPFARQLGTDPEYSAHAFGHPSKAAIMDLLAGGIGRTRAPVEVMVGLRGAWKRESASEFEPMRIDRAIYATGWDGTIVATGWQNGWIEVRTERPPPPLDRPRPTAARSLR